MKHKIFYAYRLESIATQLLERYSPRNLTRAVPLDVYDFTESFLELPIDFLNISKDKSVLGLTSFNDGFFLSWDEDRQKSNIVTIKKGTVVIDNSILSEQYPGRERFTVTHECAHQILHPYRYENADASADAVLMCSRRSIEKLSTCKIRNTEWWLEWEANRLAAELLMPLMVVKKIFLSKFKVLIDPATKKVTLNAEVDAHIYEMAEMFQVSYLAMKIRLITLEILIDRMYCFDDEIASYS